MSKILKQILLSFIFVLVVLSNSIFPVPVNANPQYKMPFRAGEVWNTNVVGARDDYGVHTDTWGYAMDFYAPQGSSLDVLSPANGVMIKGCSANGATYVRIDTDQGDTIRLLHLREDSVDLKNFNDSRRVSQGEVIGKITGPGKFSTPNCQLNSDDYHVHMSWVRAKCDFTIDGYSFNCGGMRGCAGTYWVQCNKKYLNQGFNSTNGATSAPDRSCEDRINGAYTIGQAGDDIRKLQECLKGKGFYDWPHGVTGYYGNYTAGKLVEARNAIVNAGSVPSNGCEALKGQSFKIGEVGDQVRQLQTCMKDAGIYTWPHGVTGYYGNYTQEKFNQWKGGVTASNICNDLKNTAKSWPTGKVGDDVRELQRCLQAEGRYNWQHGITGYFGNYTKGLL